MRNDKEQLKELTTELLLLVEEANHQFNETKQDERYEVDFYGKVEPFVKRVDTLIEKWKPLALSWVANEEAKYLHDQQIETTVEHLKSVSVLAFQPKASKKRIIEMVKSIRYVLEHLLTEVQ